MSGICMATQGPKERLGRNIEDFQRSVITSDAEQIAIFPELATKSGLPELGERLVDTISQRIENLNAA